MILYTEEQLENAYNVYRRHQIKQDMSFLKLEDFRAMFEEIMEWVYYEPEEDWNNLLITNYPKASLLFQSDSIKLDSSINFNMEN